LQEMRDLNDVFDRNDISSILRDLSADVKKLCSVLDVRAAASRLAIDTSKDGTSSAGKAVEGEELGVLKQQLADAVAANMQMLIGMQVCRLKISACDAHNCDTSCESGGPGALLSADTACSSPQRCIAVLTRLNVWNNLVC
jgi:hypothetical protein